MLQTRDLRTSSQQKAANTPLSLLDHQSIHDLEHVRQSATDDGAQDTHDQAAQDTHDQAAWHAADNKRLHVLLVLAKAV